LFQSKAAETGELQQILRDELDSFASVLQISQKIASQVRSLPVPTLSSMVNYRQEWIDKIRLLEEKRKKLQGADTEQPLAREYMKKISDLARELVAIDDKIYSHLQSRKLKYVQEHSDITAGINVNKKHKRNLGSSSKVDIIQE